MANQAGESFHVLILGAGSAGMLIAHGLQKRGISYTIYERDSAPASRARDWNFGIYWAQDALKACLPVELYSQIRDAQIDAHVPSDKDVLRVYNGATGEVMTDIPVPYNLRLQRRKFINLIAQGINVQYNKKAMGIRTSEQKVVVEFDDGTEVSGHLLIGCDGAHSRVRQFLFGSKEAALTQLPYTANHMVTRLPREVAMRLIEMAPRYSCSVHPAGWFCWHGLHSKNDSEDPADWEFLLSQSWKGPAKGVETVANVRERGLSFFEPLKSVFLGIPDDTPIWEIPLACWETKPWDNRSGTVTLAGDAAHPMTFHRGQGLNNAILDAARICAAFDNNFDGSTNSTARLLQDYESDVWIRGKEAVELSRENTEQVHDISRWETSILKAKGASAEDREKASHLAVNAQSGQAIA
ncbi:FAD-dependent oxidoreductase [Aspergillus novofumigatus IBT 16806]|uniref:FAD/NAD(P)-binding domain-containing protein n=1 Tax=Aspergillus novofumigatus (strain IBT 16806) TaxID=1392255 RepID=A0A2I1C126_ASPN1|nr:FAD/NAD(P)-binding domain-containing protein [Aspergillus novofumigatus IBT 16806]PKX91319.1 FAD/NAD(P)-binding domain-containing protein [Aspergillus novofumigatus IBT 16806]